MAVMRHFKFVGGPWDGEYHEMDGRDSIDVAYFSIAECQLDEQVEVTEIDPMKVCRYSLREFKSLDGDDQISFYADSKWPDMYLFSQLLHHYKGH